MAGGWNKITEKADQSRFEGPLPGDWEAMSAKIAAEPTLNTKGGRGGFWWGIGLGLLVMISIGAGYLFIGDNGDTSINQQEGVIVIDKDEAKNLQVMDDNAGESLSSNTQEEPKLDLQHSAKEVGETNDDGTVSQAEYGLNYQEVEEAVIADEWDNAGAEVESEAREEAISTMTAGNSGLGEDRLEASEQSTVESEEIEIEEPLDEMVSFSNQDVNEEAEANDILSVAEIAEGNASDAEGGENAVLEDQTEPEELMEGEEIEIISDRDKEEIIDIVLDDTEVENANSLMEEEEDGDPVAVDLRSMGFRLNSMSMGAKYLTDYSKDFYGAGVGVDVDLQKKWLLVNTGLSYYQLNSNRWINETWDEARYDTTIMVQYDTAVTEHKYPVWVIDGPYQGHYDTISYNTSSIDSTVERNIDTAITSKTRRVEERVKLSYIEMPILLGHRFRFNRFAVDVCGGVALSQTVSSNLEGGDQSEKFGLTAVLQPGVRYYLTPAWSLFVRSGLRYGLVADEFRKDKLYSNFHLGLTYHW